MKRVKLFLLFNLIIASTFAQISTITTYNNLDVLTLADPRFEAVLDTILGVEKTRDYYTPEKYFSIFFNVDKTIQIEAIDEALFESENGEVPEYGVLIYGDHPFFVSGYYFDTNIFQRSDTKKKYKYYTGTSYKNEAGEEQFVGCGLNYMYSIWIYKLTDNSYRLLDFVDTSIKQ